MATKPPNVDHSRARWMGHAFARATRVRSQARRMKYVFVVLLLNNWRHLNCLSARDEHIITIAQEPNILNVRRLKNVVEKFALDKCKKPRFTGAEFAVLHVGRRRW